MKKKLSILLVSSVIAVTLAGCHSGTANQTSSQSQMQTSSQTVQSTTASDSNNESNAKSSDTASLQEGQSKYLTIGITTVDISDSNMSKQNTDFYTPKVVTVTSVSELGQFYKQNKDKYSLDSVDSGETFKTRQKDFDSSFFKDNNIVILVQSYDKSSGLDIGEAYIDSSALKINVYKAKPSSSAKTAYACTMLTLSKSDMGKTSVSVQILKPQTEIFESQISNDALNEKSGTSSSKST